MTQSSVGPLRLSRRREATAEAIRDAAAKVFLEKGFASATIADIARELGRPRGSLHYHIDSKQDLLYQVLVTSTEEIETAVQRIARYPIPAVERLRLAIREHLQFLIEPAQAFTAGAIDRDLASLKPHHLEDINERRRRYRALISGLIQEAADAGSIQVESVEVTTRSLLSIVVQFPRWYSPHGRLNQDEMADLIWRLMFHGLAGPR